MNDAGSWTGDGMADALGLLPWDIAKDADEKVREMFTGAAGREGESRCCGISCMDSRARLLIEDGGLEDERDSDLEERFAMTGFLRRP